MNRESSLVDKLVTVLTFGSMFPILLVRLVDSQSTIFWLYTVSITGFLVFMYVATREYKPTPDVGHRPSVTVVIPAKNEEEVIEPVVRTVFESVYPATKLEVVVVDDGSTDRTWEKIQRIKLDPDLSGRFVSVRHERNYGKRVALATGVSLSHGEIIVCVDSDSFVERMRSNYSCNHFSMEMWSRSVVTGKLQTRTKEFSLKFQHYWYTEMFRLMKGVESRFGCATCCSGILSAYRKWAILPVTSQWVNERFNGNEASARDDYRPTNSQIRGLTRKLIKSPGEDRVLTSFALSNRGAKVVYQSNAIVRTIVPGTFKQFLKQQLRWKRSWIHGSMLQGRSMWKKPRPMAFVFYLYQFLTYFSPVAVILWLFIMPLRGQWEGTAGFLAGTLYVGFLHGLNTWKYLRTSIESIPYQLMFIFVSLSYP